MKTFELWLWSYWLNSLWQVPLVFLAAWGSAHLARRMGLRLQHRIWVIALILEAALPACDFQPGVVWSRLSGLLSWHHRVTDGSVRIILGPAVVRGSGMMNLPSIVIGMILSAYLLTILFFALRMLWGIWTTQRMLHGSSPVVLGPEAERSWRRLAGFFSPGKDGLQQRVRVAMSPLVSVPVTLGIFRHVLLFPPGLLSELSGEDLEVVLAHELSHVSRKDFVKNLIYGLLSLPVSYHPLLWATRSCIAESRELLCDDMAAESVEGRRNYARSLLRLAAMMSNPAPAGVFHAIGIFDANNFERRIMSLTKKPTPLKGSGRILTATACGLIAVATCTSALALHLDANAPVEHKAAPTRIKVKEDSLTPVKKVQPVYPQEAKVEGKSLEGDVLLNVVINKAGKVESIRVAKGLRNDYDRSAIDAVRYWEWKPYLLNGQPIEVETQVKVVYSLAK